MVGLDFFYSEMNCGLFLRIFTAPSFEKVGKHLIEPIGKFGAFRLLF